MNAVSVEVIVHPVQSPQAFAREWLPERVLYQLRLFRAIARARKRTRRTALKARAGHNLPQPLLLSLTSFKPRFATLHLTLKSLLNQNCIADGILLWIAESEMDQLPERVLALKPRGVAIRACPDIRSFKKLIFALQEYPNSYIATTDDDVFYEPNWLQTMVEAVDPAKQVIICHRANRVVLQEDGRIAPYLSWPRDVQDEAARRPSIDLLPTGIGGVLYPPGCFNDEVFNRRQFERLCPTADDLWFYWNARRAGSKHKKVGGKFSQTLWPTFAFANLASENWAGGNDRQIRNLEEVLGNPLTLNWS